MRGRTRTLRCRTVARLVQAYLDGELHDRRGVLIADHLDRCRDCGLDAQTWLWLKSTVAGLQTPDESEQLERLRAFVEDLTQA
ncbi:MAG: zf-HC2 domain-containing protein [Egibacteraceae bacterium]